MRSNNLIKKSYLWEGTKKDPKNNSAVMVPSTILREVSMTYQNTCAPEGCSRRTYCSCDCQHIHCPIFVG